MSTTRTALAAVAMAAVLVLAGCAGSLPGGTDAGPTDVPGEDPANVDVGGDAGTVQFYISDERNAIDDFEHLNVTVTKVGLHRVGDAGDGEDATPTETATSTATSSNNETATPPSNATETRTASATVTVSPTPGAEAEDGEGEGDDGEAEDDDGEDDGESDAQWVEYEVNRTVDLTELKGANATKLGVLQAPDGEYDKVFVHVGEVDATLKNGESVDVKLPSEKLHINKGFTLGNGGNVSFVFDLTVKKAGKSGKYIFQPVISESGTSEEVDIEDVDEREKEDEDDEDDGEDEEKGEPEGEDERDDANETEDAEEAESDLAAEFQGRVTAGKDARLKVTGADGPVANATVEVNGESVGTTDASGTITFTVPSDAEEVEVAVTKGDAEVELERDLDEGGNPALWAVS